MEFCPLTLKLIAGLEVDATSCELNGLVVKKKEGLKIEIVSKDSGSPFYFTCPKRDCNDNLLFKNDTVTVRVSESGIITIEKVCNKDG